ncbi:TonB-dependent receptor plug domain-containing protein [Marinobacter sp.]|uniref:TonB-dependent receptor plug domain-containing protein n=1 Tax=Marinobacter sp. TaxID=50741 RepID=UPI0038514615
MTSSRAWYQCAAVCALVAGHVLSANAGDSPVPAKNSLQESEAHLTFDEEYDFILEESVPEVLSTTRLRQPKSRVPGTTTVIRGELIRELGILHLWEVFRLVPGMTVGFVQSNQPVVSYHGTVADEQRRLQVQVDGRTAYQPNIADVDWHAMPVPLENIERIEVTRGPNSATYGINAFLASINIITLSPEDTHGVHVRLRGGDPGYRQAFGSVGDRVGNYDWRLSFNRRESDGFGYRFINPDDGTKSTERTPFDDSFRFNSFTHDSTLTIDNRNSLDLRLGYTEVYDEEDAQQYGTDFGIQGIPAVTGDDYYVQGKWDHHFTSRHFIHFQTSFQNYNRRQEWRSCIPAGTLGNPVEICTDANQDIEEERLEFELQDTLLLSDHLRIVSGGNYREDRFESETFFNGDGSNYQTLVFGNVEFTPVYWLTFNAGGSWEKSSSLDESFFSPRFAANFQLTDNQTLRFVFSKAVRTPDAFEQSADWGYRGENIEPEFLAPALEGERIIEWQALGNLEEERIISREISYFGQFRLGDGMLSSEIKLFNDSLRDIISGVFADTDSQGNPSWDLGNFVALDQRGVELENSLEFRDSQFRLTYAFLDQEAEYRGPPVKETREERYIRLQGRLTAEHSGSFAWIQQFQHGISGSTAYYVTRDLGEHRYDRVDLRLAKTFYQPRQTFEIAAKLQHYVHGEPIMFRDNRYDDHTHYFFEAAARF